MLAEDLFDSSDDGDEGSEQEQQQPRSERRRSDSRVKSRGSPERERVDIGAKPITTTVANVADSILDFFS